jgi:tetratricopeptide (TPR) repeat protein
MGRRPRDRSAALAAALLACVSSAAQVRAEVCIPPEVTAVLADCSAVASLPARSAGDLLKMGSAAPPQAATVTPKRPHKGPILAPRPLDAAETALAGAYQRFACDDKPSAGDTAARDQHMEVAYRRGRLYFDANHFQEAAAVFREIATSGAEAPLGVYAMQLYLESIRLLGAQGRDRCAGDMIRDVPEFIGLYCKGGREKKNAEACALLDRLERDIARLAAENDVRAAAQLPREQGMDRFRSGGDRYMEVWHRWGQGPCAAKEPGCARMEEVLYNAARAYQAARDFPKALAARRILIDPKYHLESTELAKRTLYEIGGTFQALVEWEQAATWYERYAATVPTNEKAPEALQDAVVLRLALGQDEAAILDAERFVKTYGAKRSAQAARIAFAIAHHHVERGAWEDARRRFAAAMPLVENAATEDPTLPIVAHAGFAQAYLRLGKSKDAAAEYGLVVARFRASAPARRAMVNHFGYDDYDLQRLAKALTAMGEAIVFFADERRRAAEAIRLPVYAGSGRRKDIAEFVATKLAPAMVARGKAVEDAEKAYLQVLELEPMPPPKWVVVAAARVARMRGLFAAELRALPAPKSWNQHGESPWATRWEDIRASWRDVLIDASEPEYRVARAAYRRCVELSVKFQSFDDEVLRCAAWLERNFPAERARLDELAPRAKHLASGISERPEPLLDPRPAP